MKHYSLDTNALLRYLLHDDKEQSYCVGKLFAQAQEGEIELFLSQIIFFESVYVLTKIYNVRRKDVSEQLLRITQMPYLDIQERRLISSALKALSATSLSFADAYLVYEARHKGKELFTFDKKLQKLASELPE